MLRKQEPHPLRLFVAGYSKLPELSLQNFLLSVCLLKDKAFLNDLGIQEN